MLDSIRIQSEMISLESFNPSQTFKALTTRLPGFVNSVKSFIFEIIDPLHGAQGLVDGKASIRALNDMKYMDVRGNQVYVPTGLKVSYLEFLEALQSAEQVADRLVPETLNPLSVWLATALASPDTLGSMRGIVITNYKSHDIDTPNRKIAACFDKNGVTGLVPMGQAIKRNADWPLVIDAVNELNTKFNAVNRTEIIKLVEHVTEMLDRLVLRIQSEPETYVISGANMNALAKLCYSVAREIEFYSLFAYQMQMVTVAVKDTAKLIENNFVVND